MDDVYAFIIERLRELLEERGLRDDADECIRKAIGDYDEEHKCLTVLFDNCPLYQLQLGLKDGEGQ